MLLCDVYCKVTVYCVLCTASLLGVVCCVMCAVYSKVNV